MQRRSFIQKSSMSGIALALLPSLLLNTQDDFSILELMGKESIDVFGEDINLRKNAHNAFVAMQKAAQKDGFALKIVSSYRDFYRQEGIWERKYIKYTENDGLSPIDAIDKIIEYSTIPGTSRHHWGTDIDITDGNKKIQGDLLVPEKFEGDGPFSGLKKWMDEHSESFGFHLVYTNNPKRRGFKYEPWHYSYAPISIPMLTAYRRKNIVALLQKEEFYGSEDFTSGFLKTYIRDNILDINPALL